MSRWLTIIPTSTRLSSNISLNLKLYQYFLKLLIFLISQFSSDVMENIYSLGTYHTGRRIRSHQFSVQRLDYIKTSSIVTCKKNFYFIIIILVLFYGMINSIDTHIDQYRGFCSHQYRVGHRREKPWNRYIESTACSECRETLGSMWCLQKLQTIFRRRVFVKSVFIDI